MPVKVECKGAPSDAGISDLKSRIEELLQRKLRFRSDVTVYREGELQAEYGRTGKAKLLETQKPGE